MESTYRKHRNHIPQKYPWHPLTSTNDSKVNSLSDFSRKSRLKGAREISVLYAYDIERGEPVCSKCFPGNMLDSTAYEAFIADNGIRKGIIVGDKGFPSSSAKRHFAENRNLHYLNPLKRNSRLIESYELLAYEGQLPDNETIWARLILYNFCMEIVSNANVPEKIRKHPHKIDIANALRTCHNFLRCTPGHENDLDVMKLIERAHSPVRPGRMAPRRHRPHFPKSFQYRGA